MCICIQTCSQIYRSIVTTYISVAKLPSGKNAWCLNSAPSLDDVMSHSELTRIFFFQVIGIDQQDIYGMHISECSVKDGLGWSHQLLINSEG